MRSQHYSKGVSIMHAVWNSTHTVMSAVETAAVRCWTQKCTQLVLTAPLKTAHQHQVNNFSYLLCCVIKKNSHCKYTQPSVKDTPSREQPCFNGDANPCWTDRPSQIESRQASTCVRKKPNNFQLQLQVLNKFNFMKNISV